jgi:CRP-like cAMP-binding protein
MKASAIGMFSMMHLTDHETGITAEEREKFAKFYFHYRLGDEIIREGQGDNALYLLRYGKIGVYKRIDGGQRQIATIEAVNIFGEIAPVTDCPRTATIQVTSSDAIIYKFQAFDLHVIYSNASWAEMLITRLCYDLKETNRQNGEMAALLAQKTKLAKDLEEQIELIWSAWIKIQRVIIASSIVNSREWQFLSSLRELIASYARTYWPDMQARVGEDGSYEAVEKLQNRGLLPELITDLMRK